jgi:hypothetical protein
MFLPIDPIFVNHYLSQFASSQSFSQSMTMRCRQQTVSPNNTNIPELNIRFNDESVELVDNHKHLGVTFVSDGNWTVHIENIFCTCIYKNQYRELNKKIIKDIFELRTMYDTDYIINIVI